LSRAAIAKSNMYDNAPEETRYIYTDFDSKGERLVGENHYSVTFRKGRVATGEWILVAHFSTTRHICWLCSTIR